MTDFPLSYEWIETLPALERAVGILGGAKIIGVDLESDSMYHYFEKVCLLQLASESSSCVVDTLSLRDLSVSIPTFLQSQHSQGIPRCGL